MTDELIKEVTNRQPEFRFGSAEIVGLGAAEEKVRNAGLQITLTPLADSMKALDKTALKALGGAAVGSMFGPLGAAVGALGAVLVGTTASSHEATEEPKGHEVLKANNFQAGAKTRFPFG